MTVSLLAVRDLSIDYGSRGRRHKAVRGVSFSIQPGEVVALVGESGSGKSTIALAAMGMLPDTARIAGGSIRLHDREIVGLGEAALSGLRGRTVGWIPQDPMIALNPLHRAGRQVGEPLRIHGLVRKSAEAERVVALLDRVRIARPAERAHQFPHELSGGMRQRVLIAGAIGPEPRLIIADEPTTALDVTVQKAILDDVMALVAAGGLSMLLITHDLAVAAERADRIIVLKDGLVVETGLTAKVMGRPEHDYTRMLLARAPSLETGRRVAAPAPCRDRPVDDAPILSVQGVSRRFPTARGGTALAVDGVSLDVRRGKTVAVVGESGSGKSTTARIALGLTRPDSGRVLFEGRDVTRLNAEARRRMRQLVQPVYQNPFASLNPRFTVQQIIAEPLEGFGLGNRLERKRRIRDLLDQVGLPQAYAGRRPGELSGGQRQRVAIARALAPEPALLICDEPVSALDVSIQAQILDLLAELQAAHDLGFLFISHDLAVVRQVADEVVVMKDGRIVEAAPADHLFAAPQHEYTRLLLASVPGEPRKISA